MDFKKITSQEWDYFNLPDFITEIVKKGLSTFQKLFPDSFLRLSLELDHGDTYLDKLSRKSGVVTYDQYMKAEYADNSHSVQAFRLQKGFTIVKHKILTELNLRMHRKNPAKNNLYEFVFSHPDYKHPMILDGETKVLGEGSLLAGAWFSPNIHFFAEMQRDEKLHFISIVLDGDVMGGFVNYDSDDIIHELIQQKKEFYHFCESDQEINTLLRKVFNHAIFNLAGMIELEGMIKLLIARFLQKVMKKEQIEGAGVQSRYNTDRAIQAREMIISNLTDKPNLDTLSRELGTNRVTLQKEFKQQFGDSIYQFYINIRLESAKEMLESGEYNVSEVSDSLGYMSLGQFSKSFQKQYGCNPSEIKR